MAQAERKGAETTVKDDAGASHVPVATMQDRQMARVFFLRVEESDFETRTCQRARTYTGNE